jgi:hypothetical protein
MKLLRPETEIGAIDRMIASVLERTEAVCMKGGGRKPKVQQAEREERKAGHSILSRFLQEWPLG